MKCTYKGLSVLLLIFSALGLWAQNPNKEIKYKNEKVKLERTDMLEGGLFNGQKINKFKGNVMFRQNEIYLYCDSAYQYQQEKSKFEAFGYVRMTQGDSVTLTGIRLTYFGEVRKAIMTGNVFLRDQRSTLTAPYLEYDFRNNQGYFR